MYDKNNIFAKIIRKEIPCKLVYEDEHVLAFHDIAALAPVHVLVVPKGEYVSFDDFCVAASAEIVGSFFAKVRQIANKINVSKSGYRIITNHGADASQTVPHFHVHIIGGKKLGGLIEESDNSTAQSQIQHNKNNQTAIEHYQNLTQNFKLASSGEFRFQTTQQARGLAKMVSLLCDNSEEVLVGIEELMLNAIEHGNLNISFEQKTSLLRSGKFANELEEKLGLEAFGKKFARLSFKVDADEDIIEFRVTDDGKGFDWKAFLESPPDSSNLPNGRGITIAKMCGFKSIEYRNNGSEVVFKATRAKTTNESL